MYLEDGLINNYNYYVKGEMHMNIVSIKNLTKYYNKIKGIENVNLEIQEGEIFGLIGPNGAGKSTTIRTLLSLIYPTSGSAKIFGLDTVKDSDEILQNVGYLPSEVFYYENMKAIDLLKYSASFYKKDCTKRIKELANLLELDLNRRIEDLSYGNRKKVGIIQGLIHQPKLIILDEPTGGLDPLMQQRFFELIRQENQRGATIIFSSHILSEVQKICDRVAFVKDGEIIRVDSIANIRENSYLKIYFKSNEPISLSKFSLPGVTNINLNDNDECTFLYQGPINPILTAINSYSIANIMMEEPDLEDIFLHYYK